MDEILKFYHVKSQELPESITDPNGQLEYLLRPWGIMRRPVNLEKGWYKDATGAMLAVRKEDGAYTALIPGKFTGYTFLDGSGNRVRVTAANADLFEVRAMAFYKPFPLRSMGMQDLLRYMAECLSTSDFLLMGLASLAISLIGLLTPFLNKLIFSDVVESGSLRLLLSVTIFLICVNVSTLLLGAVRELLLSKINTKLSLSVEAAAMMRVFSLPADFFQNYSSGVQKIKLAGAEKRAFARWANLYAQQAQATYNPPTIIKLNSVIGTAVSLTGVIVMYYAAVQSQVSVSEYYAFNAAYGMVSGAFMTLTSLALSAVQFKPMFGMIKPILDTVPEVSSGKEVITRLSGGVELNNVSFRYRQDTPPVIDNLSLKIRPGQYIAIVGATGCGKSTLMRLLLGFERPQKGAIYYDGKDLTSIDLKSLRQNVGVVMQNGKLFSGNIYSNITISAPYLTMDDAWEAAEMAGIADDIRRMPMGMHTLISEGSGGVSGGQRQRLLIARAIAPKPKILMFDEATSSLDNLTQKRVSQSLSGLKCTRIVIAHRLSTIKECDRILVLDGGKIAEDGTFDQLLEQGGLFAQLVERQRLSV